MLENAIRILLVDDHLVVRNGVRMMLSGAPDILIVAEAASAQQAMELAKQHVPDVALVDIALPDRNGLELLSSLKIIQPGLAILVLSMYSEIIYATRAIKLGAAGYLTKDSAPSILIAAIRKAASGGKYITPALADQMALALAEGVNHRHETLSNRELEVMKLIASGESLINIGNLLHLSPSTITTYRSRILEKMNMKNNIELAHYASQIGLLS